MVAKGGNDMELSRIATERRNERSFHIDELSAIEMVKLINDEDKKVALAVEQVLEQIAAAVEVIAAQLRQGGRLVYSGCGTSGRLGVLDAAECPPTYSTAPEMVVGIIAGGERAMFQAVEGTEDNRELGAEDLKAIDFNAKDVLVGIAASGRTPYVLGAMEYARSLGAHVLAVTCCAGSEADCLADIGIAPAPGPEVVTGSTRMKSGTAEKMVLNMLSTGAMIQLGKVYGNLMVDVKPANEKLIQRCISIVQSATGIERAAAVATLERCEYRPKTAIIMILLQVDETRAAEILEENKGHIGAAVRKGKAEEVAGCV